MNTSPLADSGCCKGNIYIYIYIAGGNPTHEQQFMAYAKACVEPGYNYFCSKFDNGLKPVLIAFKVACYNIFLFVKVL